MEEQRWLERSRIDEGRRIDMQEGVEDSSVQKRDKNNYSSEKIQRLICPTSRTVTMMEQWYGGKQ